MKSIAALILLVAAAFAQPRARMGEYALVLEDVPVAQMSHSREALKSPQSIAHQKKIESAQGTVLAELAKRKIAVRHAASLLVNAIYVDAANVGGAKMHGWSLAAIPGVKRVQFLPPIRRDLNAAVNLVNASAAWSAVGGVGNAGRGMRIGIIDTGIDQTHPGFQDSSLTPPDGFPKGDAGYTNNKVIVARSYVSTLSAHTYALPDDNSPRDRTGHGTAIAMIAAGTQHTSPMGVIQGVAPKAFLGNYKIFGSPGVNDFTYEDVIDKALADAIADGMDVVTLSINEGDMEQFGPFDGSAECDDDVCDVRAQGAENAVRMGLTVVTSAGNDGDVGSKLPTRNTLHTPGSSPRAITVGASTNSHVVYQTVRYNNVNVRGLFGDGTRIAAPLNAPARDVAALGNDGLACSALPAGSLTGRVALVQRGTCFFADKINNAQAAGAVAVVIYQSEGSEAIYPILYVANAAIPAVLIGNTDGKALKTYLASNANGSVTLDPAYGASDNGSVNSVASFSSRGPSLGNFANQRDFAVKPELVAPGVDLYTATQKFDPNGDTYNPTGYAGVSGTSFAVPFVAGAVALVKQQHKNMTPAQLKSAVVNTATSDLQGGARITDAGAGRLNIADAVAVAATLDPAAISFGPVPAALPINNNLAVTNVSSAAATFTFTVRERAGSPNARVQVTPATVTLGPGETTAQPVTVSLVGTRPSAGAYEGFVDVTGAGPTLHLPYTFFVGDGVPYDVFPIIGGHIFDFPNVTGYRTALRVIDQYGVPVRNFPTTFRVQSGGGKIESGSTATDAIGTAAWFVDLGPQLGDQVFTATVGGLTLPFEAFSRRVNAIKAGGIVNAATFQLGQGLAPGSYISIFGTDLADTTATETTPYLPVSLASVAVSFYGGGITLPGRLHFVSPTQVNVQIPWEFQGQSSVRIKVSLNNFLWDDFVTIPLAQYSPGVFAVTDSTGGVIGANNPAKRGPDGGGIVIYANGLGPVDIQPVSGEATPATQPLSNTKVRATATIGGMPADVIFSGLTPGSIGLYQVNVVIPANAPTGSQALTVSIGGQDVTLNIPVV